MEKTVPQCQNSGMRTETQSTLLLSSCYLAPIEYYALIMLIGRATIEICDNYQKQSYRNRCHIAGANGRHTLTIPIEKPSGNCTTMKDIRIADYGDWQHNHWHAIISAYRSTPFFQYYEDDFRPFYERKALFLHDFNEGLRELVFKLLDLEAPISYSNEFITQPSLTLLDYREIIHPKKRPISATPNYYQVFAEKNGFIHNLSIIDLLFNMGNEARIILKQLSKHPKKEYTDPHTTTKQSQS